MRSSQTFLTPKLIRGWLPPRPRKAHKGDFGHVLVVAGSRGLMGAARLCAMGALRGGAGLVTLAAPKSELSGSARPWETMTLPLPSTGGALAPSAAKKVFDFVKARRVTAVVLGPGLSTRPGAARTVLALVEKLQTPVVADADALNALAARPVRRGKPWIVTPHPGEAARLLRSTVAAVQKGRFAAARSLAERLGAVALLKGMETLVTDGRTTYKNGTGNPAMASGGMGDVLAGLAGALVAQVRAASIAEACLRAAAAAAYVHGRAGDRAARELGPAGVLASDLAARVPAVFKELS